MNPIQGGLLSKSASAYEHLKRMAISGLMRPERRLSPPDLARELRISVTPIRDALARLAAEGFIRGEDGRGYFTKPHTVQEQHDLLRLLFTYFLSCLDGARERRLSEAAIGLPDLEAARESSCSTQNSEAAATAYTDALDRFLAGLAAASGNSVLPTLLRNVVDRTRYLRELDLREASHRTAMTETLRRLTEAVLRADLVGAVAICRDFLTDIHARLPSLVQVANAKTSQLRFP